VRILFAALGNFGTSVGSVYRIRHGGSILATVISTTKSRLRRRRPEEILALKLLDRTRSAVLHLPNNGIVLVSQYERSFAHLQPFEKFLRAGDKKFVHGMTSDQNLREKDVLSTILKKSEIMLEGRTVDPAAIDLFRFFRRQTEKHEPVLVSNWPLDIHPKHRKKSTISGTYRCKKLSEDDCVEKVFESLLLPEFKEAVMHVRHLFEPIPGRESELTCRSWKYSVEAAGENPIELRIMIGLDPIAGGAIVEGKESVKRPYHRRSRTDLLHSLEPHISLFWLDSTNRLIGMFLHLSPDTQGRAALSCIELTSYWAPSLFDAYPDLTRVMEMAIEQCTCKESLAKTSVICKNSAASETSPVENEQIAERMALLAGRIRNLESLSPCLVTSLCKHLTEISELLVVPMVPDAGHSQQENLVSGSSIPDKIHALLTIAEELDPPKSIRAVDKLGISIIQDLVEGERISDQQLPDKAAFVNAANRVLKATGHRLLLPNGKLGTFKHSKPLGSVGYVQFNSPGKGAIGRLGRDEIKIVRLRPRENVTIDHDMA
jgi:hypothetical protein